MPLLFEDKQKSFFRYKSNLCFPAHLHRAVELGVVEEGTCAFQVEGRDFVAEQGDIFVIFPDLIHSYGDCPSKTLMCILTTLDLKVYDSVFRDFVPEVPLIKKGQWENSGLETLLPLFAKEMQWETEAVLQGYYQAIVGKCLSLLTLKRRQKEPSDHLREILTYINAHSKEEISRKSLAKAVGISEGAVSDIFAGTLKMSLPEYLHSIRVGEAEKLLRETKLSVTEIAEVSGFGSIRSFNRAFSERFGVSPSGYRRKN
jgi:AraC-like DNA-binding protein